MSYYDGFTPTYTFSLCIERSDRVLVDTTVEVKATAEEIAKAKKTIQRLMNEYAPVAKAPAPAADPAEPEMESQAPIDPTDPPEPEAAPTTPPDKKSGGARGLLHPYCKECGRAFTTFLRECQTEVDCKCGHQIDLTAPLATFAYTCPYCEQTRWGKTNLEDPDITVRCKCGGDVNLRWAPKSREYQN